MKGATVTVQQDDEVLVRRLDLTIRRADEVKSLSTHSDGGLLIENFVGRYVLDRDARAVWRLLDGHRSIATVAEELAAEGRGDVEETLAEVRALCQRLLELGLVERIDIP